MLKILRGSIGQSCLAVLIFFSVFELLLRGAYSVRNAMVDQVPVPYVLGGDYGPVPPWLDGLRMLEPDERLLWRGRPGFRQKYIDNFAPFHTQEERRVVFRRFFPSGKPAHEASAVWEISLNSEGFRDEEFPREKRKTAFRVICLGDSWTVGSNVNQDEAFPQRLRAMLKEAYPKADFEVLNMGVFGYTSYHGVQMMARALELEPDMLVLGFAMNESNTAGLRDWSAADGGDEPPPSSPFSFKEGMHGFEAFFSRNFEAYKLLKYFAQLLAWRPISMGQHLLTHEDSYRGFRWMAESAEKDSWMRRLVSDYESNYLEMIRLARRRGARVVLLYPDFRRESPFLRVLRRISQENGIPLVDGSLLISQAQREAEAELEAKLGLRPPAEPGGNQGNGEEIEVIFRVYGEERPVPAAIYLVGTHEKLGKLVPNKLAMADDGTQGDQKASDRVWSYAARFRRGERLFYTYTNSGREGHWEGLDVPVLRTLAVEPPPGARRFHAPIDIFGRMNLYADPWHTDAAGNRLIAGALLEELKKDGAVRRYLKGRP